MKQLYMFLRQTFALLFITFSCISSFSQNTPSVDWVHLYGDDSYDWGYAVKTDSKGNIYLMGSFSDRLDLDPGPDSLILESIPGKRSVYFAKLDFTGKPIWARQLDDFISNYPLDKKTFDVDPQGNVFFSWTFIRSIADVDPGPGLRRLFAKGDKDVFTIKLDKDGDLQWVSQLGGADAWFYDESIYADPFGNIFVTGLMRGSVDFDPGPGSQILTSHPTHAALFIQKLDPNGNLLWAKMVNNNQSLNRYAGATDPAGNFLIASTFSDTLDVDPGPGVHEIISQVQSNYFILKLDDEGSS